MLRSKSRMPYFFDVFIRKKSAHYPEGIQDFIFKPQPVFDGHRAFQLISIGDYDRVLSALAADYEGTGF